MPVSETIALIANISLALSFVVGLIFGIAQVKAATRDRKERFSMEALRNFQTREFAELMQFVNSHELPKSQEELLTQPAAEQASFIQLAQEMETLGILVAEKLINMDMVDKTLGSFVTSSWEKYKPMVYDTRKSDPYLAEYFEWLAMCVSKRMKESPRRPFYETNLPA